MLRSLAYRLLPRRCVVCELQPGAPSTSICTQCEADFFAAETARCERCAIRLPDEQIRRAAHLRALPGQCAALRRNDDAGRLRFTGRRHGDGAEIHRPTGSRPIFWRAVGKSTAVGLASRRASVSSSPCRWRSSACGSADSINRTRSHALLLSAAGRRLVVDRLLRIRHTPPQQSLALNERRRNVRGAFAVEGSLNGQHVFVVDDVMTTGSTLNEVARVLKQAGAAQVHNLIVARTP